MAVISDLTDLLTQKNIKFLLNEPMFRHTTFKIGGPADIMVIPNNKNQIIDILHACKNLAIPVTVVGNGSDLLVSDLGIEGCVIKIGDMMSDIRLINDITISCGAGASLSKLCSFALKNNLTGLEFAWGIPGSAGGAAYMNAGAYNGQMSDVLLRCHHITLDGKIGYIDKQNLDLSYRHSAYTDNGYIITEIEVELHPGIRDKIHSRMDELMQRRKDKQPLEYPSAGSVFKRPTGYFAGALIEKNNLKGKSIGGAMVSQKHAGFIINTGNATCSDVLSLIKYIQQTVLENDKVKLECEIKAIGRGC